MPRGNHGKEELKQLIINTGFTIVKNKGFLELGARKIAKEIGYSVGTLYNIFKDHDDIILHINAKTLDNLTNFISENLDKNLQKEFLVKKLANLHLEFALKNHNLWKLLFEHPVSASNSLKEFFDKKNQQLLEEFEESLIKFIEPNFGIFIDRNAKSLWAGIYGICSLAVNKNFTSGSYDEKMMDCLVEAFLRGL